MSSDTPSWLAAGSQTSAPAPSPLEVTTPAPKSSGTQLSGAATTSADEDKDLPSIILMMRLTNMGMAAAIVATAVSLA